MRNVTAIVTLVAVQIAVLYAQEAAMPPESTAGSLVTFFLSGGQMMGPILVALLMGAGYALERGVMLARRRHIPADFEQDVVHMVDIRGVDAGLTLCKEKPSSLSRLMHAALLRHGTSRQEMENAVSAEAQRIQYELRRNVRSIGFFAALAPLLGLLGLCAALIAAFNVPVESADPGALAQGLASAAFGLYALIVLLSFYLLLRHSADDIIHVAEGKAIDAVVILDRKARQSIRLIEDLEDNLETKNVPGVQAPDLSAELDDHLREGSGIRTSITTHASLPTLPPGAAREGAKPE